jgi:hypothetical protein
MRWQDRPLSAGCRWDGRRATVTVCGEVNLATAGILAQLVDEVVRQEPEHLIVDRARRALPPQCPVILRSPRRQVRVALEVSGLTALCPIEEPGQTGQAGLDGAFDAGTYPGSAPPAPSDAQAGLPCLSA